MAIIADGPDSPPENAVWHSDMSPFKPPPFGSVLQARVTPPVGGDTLWCSMTAICQALPASVRAALEGRVAVHDLEYGYRGNLDNGKMENRAGALRDTDDDQRLSRHPVMRFQMRVRWQPGTVVVYDNLATQHHAVGDHFPAVREMNRVTIGECRWA